MRKEETLIIIGAGLAGLSAALTAANQEIPCVLVSEQPSQRAQSVLAEGGISGESAGETLLHWEDTVRSGCGLSDPNAVRGMVQAAPEILRKLEDLGTPFEKTGGTFFLRKMGGHSKARTVFAGNHTGKVIMNALTDAVRKKESMGLVKRMDHFSFVRLLLLDGACRGCKVQDWKNGEIQTLYGPVILACGGMRGIFQGQSTGMVKNDGRVTAQVFSQGVELGNLEMIQYHPTTIPISGKNLLISEAARSAGGRLFIQRKGQPWYFLEERYGANGNLAARDQIVRAMWEVGQQKDCCLPFYLDLRGIPKELWQNNLAGLREECETFLGKDPQKVPIPTEPAVHYFMGGILVDEKHHTNKKFLYAAGECACQYHGANRLGGNSLLGALYGGSVAAQTAFLEVKEFQGQREFFPEDAVEVEEHCENENSRIRQRVSVLLSAALGTARCEEALKEAGRQLEELRKEPEASAEERGSQSRTGRPFSTSLKMKKRPWQQR